MRGFLVTAGVAAIVCALVMSFAGTPGAQMIAPVPAVAADPNAAPETTVLFDFETDEEVAAWTVEAEIKDKVALSASAEHATSGKRSLKMTLKPHEWPGASTTKVVKDWSGAQDLVFDVWAESAGSITVRVDDQASNSFATRYNSAAQDVNKGANTVSIPAADIGDAIDLKKVKSLHLFSTDVPEDRTFFIDNIRLVKAKK